MAYRSVQRALVIAPLLVACAGTADARPRPRPANATAAAPDLTRGEALALDAHRLDGLAKEEEGATKFAIKTGAEHRARSRALRKEAADAEDVERDALLAKAEASDVDA